MASVEVSFSDDDLALLRSAAQAAGESLTDFVRNAALQRAGRRLAGRDAILGRIVEEHDGLLNRLAEE